MFKLVLEKAEEPEIKLLTSIGSSEKQDSSIKIAISAALTMPKPLTIPIPKKGNAKEFSNYHTIALISKASIPKNKVSRCNHCFPIYLP